MRQTKRALLVLATAYAVLGSECINDPFVVSVNVEALEAVINIPAGSTTTFAGVTTISASEYFTTDVGAIQNLRIYDITVQSVGSYGRWSPMRGRGAHSPRRSPCWRRRAV
jgi:hypothetical protein